ncbi:MAG: PHP domain-containing protein [Lachnospiraceae bacterium]|nr:PHP domain-containing protein [Lachnospiraceae bacterium]
MKPIDLHVHSNKSDGSFSPSELVDYALEKGLSAFALTDHDTVDGVKDVIKAAAYKPIEVIPGIELSTEYEGRDIHILGLYINTESPDFLAKLEEFKNSRILRNEKMCDALAKGTGMDISYEKLQNFFPDSVITRGHYAKYMQDKGYIKSYAEAFERYIGDHSPYFIPREKVTPAKAIHLILSAGGIPILAHPTLYKMGRERLELLVSQLKKEGLVGIEAVYTTYSNSEEREIKALAKKYDLLITGGSDFHGTTKVHTDLGVGHGNLFVPEDLLLKIKEYRNEYND